MAGVRNLKRVLLGGASLLMVHTGAAAQSTPPPGQSAAAQAGPSPGSGGQAQVGEVVVTATRTGRSGFTAPTPVSVISDTDFKIQGATSTLNVFNDLPQVRITTQGSSSNNSGGSYFNLRGLGPNRTLVLVDGERFVPETTTGLVDLNILPAAMIERSEVVTGGASSEWGSDAVAGVNNIIYKKKIDGFVGNVEYGDGQYGRPQEETLQLAWGGGFAGGKGQVMLAGEYDNNSQPLKQGSTPWGQEQVGLVSGLINGSNVARIPASGLTLSGVTTGGVIVSASGGPLAATSPLRGIQFGPGGTVLPFQYGSDVTSTLQVGGGGAWAGGTVPLEPRPTRKNLMGRATYDLTPDITGSVDFLVSQTHSNYEYVDDIIPNSDTPLSISVNNPYLPASVKNIMTANGLTSFSLGRWNTEFPGPVTDLLNTTKRVSGQLNGNFGQTGHWNVYATYGTTDIDAKVENNLNEANFRAAVDVIKDPVTGNPICNPATVAALGAAPGCVPANVFGAGSISPAVANYVLGTASLFSTYDQTAGGATVSGEPISLWAGPISLTGGIEGRRESVVGAPDAISALSTTAFPVGGWQQFDPKAIDGSYSVIEGFAETVVPLLKEQAWAKSLDFNGAFRETHYSTSGYVSTWKAGFVYVPVDGFRFRAGQSRDIRAPNLSELYSTRISTTPITDYGQASDPSAAVRDVQIGSTKLVPEIADTTTAGATWQNNPLGLKISVDYYHIKLQGAIATLGGQNIVNLCYGALGNPATQSYCSLIVRGAGGSITQINDPYSNIAKYDLDGIDTEVSYRAPIDRIGVPGSLQFHLVASYLNKWYFYNGFTNVNQVGQVGDPTAGTTAYSGPKWRGTLSSTYTKGPLTVWLQGRLVGAGIYNATYGASAISDNNVPSIMYMDGSINYDIIQKGRLNMTVYLAVNNLLNQAPPVVTQSAVEPNATNNAFYDQIGRYISVGLRFKM